MFLLDLNPALQRKIELEHGIHHDLVQVLNLPEQYYYVTYREAAIYSFTTERCSQAKFLLKTDDDIFINLFLLYKQTNALNLFSLTELDLNMYGYPIDFGLVVRKASDSIGERYVITEEEYSCPRYPRFLSGFAYLTSKKVCSLLLGAFQADFKPFALSDVYFTGLLPEIMNLDRLNLSPKVDYLFYRPCDNDFFLSVSRDSFACAASNKHFDETSTQSSMMNEYHEWWRLIKQQAVIDNRW